MTTLQMHCLLWPPMLIFNSLQVLLAVSSHDGNKVGAEDVAPLADCLPSPGSIPQKNRCGRTHL